MGQVRETGAEGNRCDGAARQSAVRQQAAGKFQTPREHEFGEGRDFCFKELVNIALHHTVTRGDRRD
jgi:hypothetical protein